MKILCFADLHGDIVALNKLIAKSTGVPCFIAKEPLFCVAKGTGIVLENLDLYKKSIMSKRRF